MPRQSCDQPIDPEARGAISRRALLVAGGVAAGSLLASCADEEPAVVPGADAGADAGRDAGVDSGADAGVDVAIDAGADTGADAAADAGADVGPDAAPDAAPRPGILSVPADDPDVTGKDLTYQGAGTVQAYLAVPNRVGIFAGLILIPDESGLTEHIKDVARRFSKSGCVALAPDLRPGLTAEQLLANLSAGLDTLAQQPQVGANRHGAAGFGWGGGQALRFAAATPRVRAVVSYYGPVPVPADLIKTTAAAILGQYGATDDAVNAGIPELERAMKEAGKTFEKRLYPGAGHDFNDDTSPATYNEAAAVAAWPSTIGWFDVNLG